MSDSVKIMPVEKVGAVSHCMANPQSYEHEATPRWGGKPTKQRIADFALSRLEAARKLDIENHQKNLPAIENNKVVRARVEALMVEIGMPSKWSELDTKSRARYPKKITHDAGYLMDLRRACPVDDGFAQATQVYERLKKTYDEYAEEGRREAEKAKAEADRADELRRQERRANIALAEIILRYDLDRDVEWSDVLDALRQKDQRLDLAVAMQQVRGDWSDGPDAVSNALDRFKIETDEDKEIANCIVACLNPWCGDGRVFRDCSWSYDRLFASASDQQLAQDIQTAMQHSERE